MAGKCRKLAESKGITRRVRRQTVGVACGFLFFAPGGLARGGWSYHHRCLELRSVQVLEGGGGADASAGARPRSLQARYEAVMFCRLLVLQSVGDGSTKMVLLRPQMPAGRGTHRSFGVCVLGQLLGRAAEPNRATKGSVGLGRVWFPNWRIVLGREAKHVPEPAEMCIHQARSAPSDRGPARPHSEKAREEAVLGRRLAPCGAAGPSPGLPCPRRPTSCRQPSL